mmetsp:Transcript_39630/g.60680  ORF Transcript_39630/g.60680 Transcript_39630/m.60680 type:complete len:221 (+) Transcript_39630:548-1210(+)
MWNARYFPEEVLEKSESIEEDGYLIPRLCFFLVLTYVIIYFSVWKGLKSLSQVAHITVTLPYFIQAIFLIRGLALPGASIGLKYLFVPEWSIVFEIKIWKAALIQALYSTAITFGPYISFSSLRTRQDTKILPLCMALPAADLFSSLFAGLALFSFMGHVSDRLGVEMKDIVKGGWDLAFTAYPGLMTTLAMPNFWSLLFFVMLMMMGIDSIFGCYIYII